jgi:hypothetical protein
LHFNCLRTPQQLAQVAPHAFQLCLMCAPGCQDCCYATAAAPRFQQVLLFLCGALAGLWVAPHSHLTLSWFRQG